MEVLKEERDKESEQPSDYLVYEEKDSVCFIRLCTQFLSA